MYSFAPAWIAATAARASLVMPQATIGTWMCSASSRITRSRMSMATSTSSRSAPLPPRTTRIASSMSSACVSLAPLSIAILVAVVSCPFRVPTIKSRMICSCQYRAIFGVRFDASRGLRAFRLDDFRHGYAKLVFHQNHFATRHQPIVDVDVDRLANAAVQFEHRAWPQLQKIADIHFRAAKHRRDLNRNVEHRLEIGSDTCAALVLLGEGGLIERRSLGLVQVRRRDLPLSISITHESLPAGC